MAWTSALYVILNNLISVETKRTSDKSHVSDASARPDPFYTENWAVKLSLI